MATHKTIIFYIGQLPLANSIQNSRLPAAGDDAIYEQ
jgi:hypothetical protein